MRLQCKTEGETEVETEVQIVVVTAVEIDVKWNGMKWELQWRLMGLHTHRICMCMQTGMLSYAPMKI